MEQIKEMIAVVIEKLFQDKFKTDVEVKKSPDLNQSSESLVKKLVSLENKPTTTTTLNKNNKRFRTNEEASHSLVDEKKFNNTSEYPCKVIKTGTKEQPCDNHLSLQEKQFKEILIIAKNKEQEMNELKTKNKDLENQITAYKLKAIKLLKEKETAINENLNLLEQLRQANIKNESMQNTFSNF